MLVNITGSQELPVGNIKIRGISFKDTALTYLGTTPADVHYLPSTGDWALQRSGAVTLTGVEGVAVEHCEFTRCDGATTTVSHN